MADLLDELNRRIQGDNLKTISRQVGADERATERGVQEALPTLLEALRRNAKSQQGRESLERAIDRDHQGDAVEDMSGYLEKPEAKNGDGILGHIFGNKRGAVESVLGKRSGLSAKSMGTLLVTLAPLVLGMLGKMKKSGGGGGIGDILKKNTGGLGSKAGCLMSLLPLLSKFIKR